MEKEKVRILVAEDERTLSFFLKKALEEERYEVEVSHSGDEALQKVAANPFHLIIADLRMPGLGGLQLIKAARVLNGSTKAILMTAYGSDGAETEAQRLGVEGYINKPFVMSEMVGLVNRAVGAPTP